MNKKGFTLIELLAVIVIMSIIVTLTFYSIRGSVQKSHKTMLETKLNSAREAAIVYGQENQNTMIFNTCTLNAGGKNINKKCVKVTIQELIDEGYLETEEVDSSGKKILKNDVNGKSLNNEKVWIYRQNNRIYAETEYMLRTKSE